MKDGGFLTMNRFGPFDIESSSHMNLLAGVLRKLIPYAAQYPAQKKSPSPPSSPSLPPTGSPIAEKRIESPWTPPQNSERPGRQGAPSADSAKLAQILGELKLEERSDQDSRSSPESPPGGPQQPIQLSEGHSGSQRATPPAQEGVQNSLSLGSDNDIEAPDPEGGSRRGDGSGRGRGDGGGQGRGKGRERGQGRGQGRGRGKGRGQGRDAGAAV